MSSKFFTWTKGDRRNASETLKAGGIVPIPVECITIKGMEYARNNKSSSKADRKPIPLSFDSSPGSSSMHSGRANDSIALHDAAVQSATSLMHAMNDMLRSPQLSAHLSAQQRTGGLTPLHGRPRSRTAPSTPLVEAPSIEPVELPGCTPHIVTAKSFSSLHQSVNGNGVRPLVQSPMALGLKIERPHTSPQETTYTIPTHYRRPSTNSPHTTMAISLANASPQLTTSSLYCTPHQVGVAPSCDASEDTLVASESATALGPRPSLSVLQTPGGKATGLQASNEKALHAATTRTLSRAISSQAAVSAKQLEIVQQTDAEAVLMSQISLLRATHEAHVSSLKEAHEKEIASHRSYIEFLESRRVPQQLALQDDKQHLTIDTSHAGVKAAEPLNSEASATTLQSFESSLENQKRTSHEAIAEMETLKRKLSLARKAQTDASELRRERDHLRDSGDRSDRRILQLKDIVRKAKDNEKLLRNMVTDLEARLVDANNERTDVLEGYHEACEKIRKSSEREQLMTLEVEELRSRLIYAGGHHAPDTTLTLPTTTNMRPKHHRTVSDVGGMARADDPLLTVIHDLKRTIAERDARITELEADGKTTKQGLELEKTLFEHQQKLVKAEADCERYNSLLHSELRRQSKQATLKSHNTPQIDPEAFAEAAAKVRTTVQAAPNLADLAPRTDSAMGPQDVIAALEIELEHCFKEIIMYKLDIRGYKKDIRKLQVEMDSLRAISIEQPPTPDRTSESSTSSTARSSRFRPQISHPDNAPGLGISLPLMPSTPTRSVASATAIALQAHSTPPMPQLPLGSFSPPSRPKTPMGSHKRLPKPPPCSRTPSPVLPAASGRDVKLQRAETIRSLSESIISSYAKRNGTPDQGGVSRLTPPTVARGARSSDPLGPPISRFGSDTVVR